MHFHAYDGKLVSGLALKDACFSVPLSHRGSAHGMWQEPHFLVLISCISRGNQTLTQNLSLLWLHINTEKLKHK